MLNHSRGAERRIFYSRAHGERWLDLFAAHAINPRPSDRHHVARILPTHSCVCAPKSSDRLVQPG